MVEFEELLDCPFCGGLATIGEGHDHAYVTCTKCACATPVCSSIEQAIKVWNTRAAEGNKEPDTLYNKLRKSLYDVIGMACNSCRAKCGGNECSGIAMAKEALTEPPRNCDVEETYRNASCKYLKTHPEVNQNVSSWGWKNWYDFALWLFKKQEKSN